MPSPAFLMKALVVQHSRSGPRISATGANTPGWRTSSDSQASATWPLWRRIVRARSGSAFSKASSSDRTAAASAGDNAGTGHR